MNEDFNKIVLVVGAGAVENAWLPLIKAIQPNFDFEIDADCANSFFARLVYLMRFYSKLNTQDSNKSLQEALSFVDNLKENIAQELIAAEKSKTIKARKELKDILYKFVFSEIHKSVVISTNWDTVINNEINSLGQSNYPKNESDIQTFHLHGSVKSSKEFYLPSEIVQEPYRNEADDQKMGGTHGTVWLTLEQANVVILYGLSLDPLDAELCQTLAAGWASPHVKEVIIINPEHKKVAQRVKLLRSNRFRFEISGYLPSDLNKKIPYN